MAAKDRLIRISVARDFSRFPAGRTPDDNEFNGTTFRRDHLIPALRSYETVEISFDGVYALGSSFLEEAFGGLVREHEFEKEDLLARLKITADVEKADYVELCYEFIEKS